MYCNILIDGKWPCTHCTVPSIRPHPCKNPFFIISRQCDRGNTSPLPRPLNGQISTGTRWCDRHHYILINPFHSQQHSNYNLFYDTACCETGDRRERNRTARRGTNQKKEEEGERKDKGWQNTKRGGEDVGQEPRWGEEIFGWLRKKGRGETSQRRDWLPICHRQADTVKAL